MSESRQFDSGCGGHEPTHREADIAVSINSAGVTTKPNTEMADLHNRMPVILEPEAGPRWLGEVEADPATLFSPSPDGLLRTWPASKRVGSPRNNDAMLVAPLDTTI